MEAVLDKSLLNDRTLLESAVSVGMVELRAIGLLLLFEITMTVDESLGDAISTGV